MISNLDLFVECCRADHYKSHVPAELSSTLGSFNRYKNILDGMFIEIQSL
jgi:hypothetical protein